MDAFTRGALVVVTPVLAIPVIVFMKLGVWSWAATAVWLAGLVAAALLGGLAGLAWAALYRWAYRRVTRTPDFPDAN